ncbi:hypothetical protein B0H21DRAFT_776696 [Amylocystis lapponica]|nr:hypothetical protein B0H21DRAFT_776696 [Amylocystis lapponica]
MADIQHILGHHPSSEALAAHISSLASTPDAASPEVKSYPMPLLFKPINGYKPRTGLKLEDLNDANLVVDGIDIYNAPKPKPGASSKSKSEYAAYPVSPFIITLSADVLAADSKPRPSNVAIKPDTTGKDFVESMGEPDRKGGGAGPSSGSIGIWCEWSKDGVMVEFGGDESRGPQAWERGKDAVWKIISIFPPKGP